MTKSRLGIEQSVDEHPRDLRCPCASAHRARQACFVPCQQIDQPAAPESNLRAKFACGSNRHAPRRPSEDRPRAAGMDRCRRPPPAGTGVRHRSSTGNAREPPSRRTASERNAWRSPRPATGQARWHDRRGSSRAHAGIRRASRAAKSTRSPKCRMQARESAP